MTTDTGRKVLAAHLIRCARDDIPVDKLRGYLYALDIPRDAHTDELHALADLIANAQIAITWG